MPSDTLKAQARERDLKVGHFVVEFATPGIGHMLKNAGCDFVLFETEHSGFHNETIKSVMRYFEAARLPAIVRVPSKEYHHIARAADMGAEGIMLPMVNDAGEARHILDCMKYVPDGQRGVALGVAHDMYRGGAVLEKLAAANARTTFFAQIETRAGVENADAIAAVDGVDCLWVGHFDLSASLGIPGQFEHKDFLDAIDTVVRALAAASFSKTAPPRYASCATPSATPRWPSGTYFMQSRMCRASFASLTIGSMMPSAPMSAARAMWWYSLDGTRQITGSRAASK